MTSKRHVPFITLSEGHSRAWITLSGCNLRCRGCFSVARDVCGEPMTPGQVIELVASSAEGVMGGFPEEVAITGGEPTLDMGFLLELVRGVSERATRTVLWTNGTLLDEDGVNALIDAGVDEFIIDMKAWDPEVHEWYTRMTNEVVKRTVRCAAERVPVTVNTLVIPGVVDKDQVVEIARFLKGIGGDVEFRVNRFNSALAREAVARDPTDEEMRDAIAAAEAIMGTRVAGQPCSRERQGDGNTGWVTVHPDGTISHRGIGSYRAENRSLAAGN